MDTALNSVRRSELNNVPRLARGSQASENRTAAAAESAAPYRTHAIPFPAQLDRKLTFSRMVYRAFEFGATLAMLILIAPILLLEAILIRLDSPGPALFWQRRVGQSVIRRGRDIQHRDDLIPPDGGFQADGLYLVPEMVDFVKFRTMYVDARERFPDLYRVNFSSHEEFLSSYYKQEIDPRVTRIGSFLRRTTLDELPNLYLVLTGKMRLVGPRPEGPWFLPYYFPDEMLKFAVKPGVTGAAQCSGRGQLQIGDQIAYDLDYVNRRSVRLDLAILLKTLLSVLKRRGAF